jgi:hypothetical protein
MLLGFKHGRPRVELAFCLCGIAKLGICHLLTIKLFQQGVSKNNGHLWGQATRTSSDGGNAKMRKVKFVPEFFLNALPKIVFNLCNTN